MIQDPRKADYFHFGHCSYDPATANAYLHYHFDNGPELVEIINFPNAPPLLESSQPAFERALEILHLVAGVSYYKAGFSPEIRIANAASVAGRGEFLENLYLHGLAEFAYVNGLDFTDRLKFREFETASDRAGRQAFELDLPERALVAIGGGKDSLVGLEMMRTAGLKVLPVCVGQSPLIGATVETAGLELLRIGRRLAPELAVMNQAGAWNGHVPVTAVNSAILLCAAILYGFPNIVFSNERSANEATLISSDGAVINHQYSKSSAFEAAFRSVIAATVSPDIEYFSVLRPYSELGIIQRFSKMNKYHNVFSSCNRNFHLDGPRLTGRWCLNCPKCRFAALGLALFLSPGKVLTIQGADLLDDPSQRDGFRALCALGRDKPFECVGEAGESRSALAALADQPDWSGHAIVRELAPELKQLAVRPLPELLQPSPHHFIPPPVWARLQAAGVANDGA